MAVTIGSGITIGRGIGISIAPVITIGTQPSNASSFQGSTATFTTSATVNFSAVVSYQWQIQQSGIGSWTNITNATSATYNTGTLTVASDNGDKFRCVISATRGAASVNTNEVTLTVVQSVITITSQPQNQSAVAGSTATFSVTASVTESAVLSYQWYVKYRNDFNWYTITAANSSSYTTWTLSEGDAAEYFRVIVSATKGATPVTSNSASLTVVQNNTMIVGVDGDSTGANKGNRGTAFGTMVSDYFDGVFTYNPGNFVNTIAYMAPGSYSGFTVGIQGNIDNDLPSYPRVFTINNIDFTFIFDLQNQSYSYKGNLNLTVGTTVPVLYSGASFPLTPNTILVGVWAVYDDIQYGANNGIDDSLYGFYGTVFGTVVSDYLFEVSYNNISNSSTIRVKNGSYSGFSVTDGLIDNTNSDRIFTIGGTNYTFSVVTEGPYQLYKYAGEIANLSTTGVGVQIAVIYDPAENSGGGGDNTTVGTITVGYAMGRYGWQPGQMGTGNFNPNMVYWLNYDGVQTSILFITGTYSSGTVTDTTVAGKPDVTVTVGSITEIGTLESSGGGPGPIAYFTGDIFNLQSQQYQTLPVEVLASGGGGGAVTYTGGIDYASNPNSPTYPGITFSNPPPGPYVFVTSSSWTTPAGAAALLALTSGSTFTALAVPQGGGSPVTSTITLTGNWNTDWGPSGSQGAPMSSSPTVSTSYPDFVPLSVTVSGGGGGGEVASGSLTVGFDPSYNETGYDPYLPGGGIGALTINPSIIIDNLVYLGPPNSTMIMFIAGTYGSVVVTNSTINGSSSVSVTIGGVTQTGTLTAFGPSACGLQLTGDVFSLQTKVGQTLPISISTDGGGGGTAETFTQAGNWTSADWMYNGMGTGRLTMYLDSNPNPSFLAAIDSVSGSGTTVTMTDTMQGTSSAVPITGISGMSSPKPWGPYSTVSFTLASHTGQDWYNINTITLTSAGGGGGTTISNISNLFFDGYASPQTTTTFSFATQQQRDAAYTLLNQPGTWNCVGNYYSPIYGGGSPLHGSFSMSLAGPSSTDDNGPPMFMYRVISPSTINNPISDGPATGGPFSASK